MHMNNLCLVKKFFLWKKSFFYKNFCFSSRKTIFLKISKNLTASAFL